MESQCFSIATKESYGDRLSAFFSFLAPSGVQTPQEITKAHINEYAASLEGKSDSTREAYLATLKGFFAWLCEKEILLVNPASHLCIPRPSPLAPLPLGEREVVKLLDAPDTGTILGLRDRAMLEVLYSTGMRVSELLDLKLHDLDLAQGLCFIRKGKGGVCRWVPLTEASIVFIRAYLDRARPRLVKVGSGAHLFVGGGGRRLGVTGVQAICERHAHRAGIRHVHPHLLRHTAACHLLEGGASIFHVQLLLGHAEAATTQRYTHVTLTHLKGVLKACHPRG